MDQDTEEKKGGGIGEAISIMLQALVLALLLRTLLFQPFTIPSGSMKDTLLVGDYLFVSKFSYGYSKYSIPFSPDLFSGRVWSEEPKRGDIAVFKLPSDTNLDYIKRVIGLPGDKVQMIDGVLHINGEKIERIPDGFYEEENSFGATVKVPRFIETLPNGVSYAVLDINPRGVGDNTPVFEVPSGHYFMMGDNRDNSADSRFEVGFVPFENLVGRASVVFFSMREGVHPLAVWKWPTALRTDRIFKGL